MRWWLGEVVVWPQVSSWVHLDVSVEKSMITSYIHIALPYQACKCAHCLGGTGVSIQHFIQGLQHHVLAIALLHEASLNSTSGLNVTSTENVKLS